MLFNNELNVYSAKYLHLYTQCCMIFVQKHEFMFLRHIMTDLFNRQCSKNTNIFYKISGFTSKNIFIRIANEMCDFYKKYSAQLFIDWPAQLSRRLWLLITWLCRGIILTSYLLIGQRNSWLVITWLCRRIILNLINRNVVHTTECCGYYRFLLVCEKCLLAWRQTEILNFKLPEKHKFRIDKNIFYRANQYI